MDFDAFPIDILYNRSLKEVERIGTKIEPHSKGLLSYDNFKKTRNLDKLSVSVVIPTMYNFKLKSNSLRHVLTGVNNSKLIKEVVIVANDGHSERYNYLAEIVSPIKIKIIYDQNQTERASSRNFGVSKSSGKFILFLDDDMIIKDWTIIDDIIITLNEKKKKVALFPRRVYLRYPFVLRDSVLSQGIKSWKSNVNINPSNIYHDPIQEGDANLSKAFCFPGCFGIVEKSVHEFIGGFDSNYVGWGWEDVDYALRLIGTMDVLNLFYRTKGALHIDHAVSPYKQKEMLNTHKIISPKFNYTDFGTICDDVIGGVDFVPEVFNESIKIQPKRIPKILKTVENKLNVKITSKSVINRYKTVEAERASHGQGLHPKWVVIHGSRGAGTANVESDYDILILHSRGLIRQFHSPSDLNDNVEFEYSDVGKFIQISDFPFINPVQGPMELVKIAYGKILWGDESSWRAWKKDLLQTSIQNGGIYWKLMALGLLLKLGRNNNSVIRYCSYLCDVIRISDSFLDDEFLCLKKMDITKLSMQLKSSLDKNFLDWEKILNEGQVLMRGLVPEMYIALNYLKKL